MIGNPMVRKAVEVEYAVLRAPLSLLDQQVVARYFDEASVVRTSFERGLDALDSAAARLLQQTQQPTERPEPPATSPEPAAATGPATSPEPAAATEPDTLPEEEQEEVEELADELLEQEETETFRGELADEDMRRVQAELRAKHTVEEQAEHSGETGP